MSKRGSLKQKQDRLEPRVGVIIDCPQKDLFNDARDVIITSQMAVSEMVNDDHEQPLVVVYLLRRNVDIDH